MSEWTRGVKPECLAVSELREASLEAVPLLKADSKKIGMVHGDGSCHTAGLAMDIRLHSQDLAEKSVVDQIIAAMVKVHV
jgi:hypothetical protein